MKKIRSYGTVEKRPSGKWRARLGRADGWKSFGQFDTKEEAERALEEYMARNEIKSEAIEDVIGTASKPFVEIRTDGAEISTGVLDAPITDWDSILLSFGLDPNVFEVVQDKVKMSKWQSSKRLESTGDRDIIWLYSYKATFTRRKTPKITDSDIDEIRKSIKKFKTVNVKTSLEAPSTFVVLWSDWQLGKSSTGVKGTTKRILDSFDKTAKRIKELQKAGRNIEQIAFVNLGDPIECVSGHYNSQTFSVELTLRQQLLLALDLFTAGINTLSPLVPKRRFISTLSNHGEWQRSGSKSLTTDSDSADGFLSDTLQRIMDGYDLINHWHIPHDEMTTQVNLSGVECAFTHGHKITGKDFEWFRGQTLRLLKDNGKEPELWFHGHRHHLVVRDTGPFTIFQAPSMDTDGEHSSNGSKWFTDMSGQWSSSPGTLTLLVGSHDKKKWSDLAL